MTTEARAAVQYGDMRGTIAVDGLERVAAIDLLSEAGKLAIGPGEYWPVGIEICHEPNRGKGEPTIDLLFVNESVLDGRGADAVRRYAKANDTVPVRRVRTALTVGDLLWRIKRLNIVMQDKSTDGKPLMVSDGE